MNISGESFSFGIILFSYILAAMMFVILLVTTPSKKKKNSEHKDTFSLLK